MFKRSICTAALLAAPLLLAAAPALAKFTAGQYTVTFYSGPSHGDTGSQCLVFTKTGGVVGFPNSGTWDSTTFAGWGGNYVFDTGYLRIYSTFNNGANAINGYVRLSKMAGGFDDWVVSAPPIAGSNDGEITLSPGCGDVKRFTRHSGDPTK